MIQRFDRDVQPKDVSETLLRDGVVIVRNRVPEDKIQLLAEDCRPCLENQKLGGSNRYLGNGSLKGQYAMYNHSFVLGDIMCDPLFTGLADIVLGPSCDRYQIGVGALLEVWKVEGAINMTMHRDSITYAPHAFTQSPDSRPLQIQFMFAVSDFTADNGATRFVVGSNRWPEERQWKESEVDVAVMPRGSVVIWLGGTLHGFGINTTDEPRTGVTSGFTVGWLRQEENQYLSIDPERIAKFPEKLRNLLGWEPHSPLLGFHPGSVNVATAFGEPQDEQK